MSQKEGMFSQGKAPRFFVPVTNESSSAFTLNASCPQASPAMPDTWSGPARSWATTPLRRPSWSLPFLKAPHILFPGPFLCAPRASERTLSQWESTPPPSAFPDTSACLTTKRAYGQVELAVPCRDGQLDGGQLQVPPDLGARLLGKGCMGARDTGQFLPVPSPACHPRPVAQLRPLQCVS